MPWLPELSNGLRGGAGLVRRTAASARRSGRFSGLRSRSLACLGVTTLELGKGVGPALGVAGAGLLVG